MKALSTLLASQWMRRLLFPVVLTFVCMPVWATCWRVDWMVDRARQIAQQRFPGLLGSMPDVVVCEAFDFPNRAIGGRFNTGPVPTIEIPEYSLNNDLNNILAHELGHAEVNRLGSDDRSLDGHGVGWMRAMIQAGLEAEAQRVVGYMPAAANAFNMARQQVYGQTAHQWPPHDGGQEVGPQSGLGGPSGYTQCYVQQQFWLIEGRHRRLITQWVTAWCPR
jgi:hypothetical protein